MRGAHVGTRLTFTWKFPFYIFLREKSEILAILSNAIPFVEFPSQRE